MLKLMPPKHNNNNNNNVETAHTNKIGFTICYSINISWTTNVKHYYVGCCSAVNKMCVCVVCFSIIGRKILHRISLYSATHISLMNRNQHINCVCSKIVKYQKINKFCRAQKHFLFEFLAKSYNSSGLGAFDWSWECHHRVYKRDKRDIRWHWSAAPFPHRFESMSPWL